MATKLQNSSDKHLVVKSLEVLSTIKGGGVDTIKHDVQALQTAQQTLATKTEDYWSNIASDLTVTPEEKKTLYKEYQILQKEEAALIKEAEDAGYGSTFTFYTEYKNAYQDLYNMLIVEYKMFDSMVSNTQIRDRSDFISKYETYYTKRDILRNVLYSGTSGIATYSADLTPEMQVMPVDENGKPLSNSSIIIQAHIWEGADGADYAVERSALFKSLPIGTWTNDTLIINPSTLTEDINYIYITMTDAAGVSMTAIATVTKVYQAGDVDTYDMELSDNCVQINTDRTVIDPPYLTATKYRKNKEYTKETDYGYITASVDDGSEQKVCTWEKDTTGSFDEDASYAEVTKFAVLYLDSDHTKVLGPDANTAYIFTTK